MVLNEQGPGHHPCDTPCRDLDTVSSEQGSGRHILGGTSHRRLGVVQDEQGSFTPISVGVKGKEASRVN